MKMNESVNEKYLSEDGDRLALEELLPVVNKYINADNPKILEIGCGYGRNLYALSHVPEAQVTGCDISEEELQKAREKMDAYNIQNITTVLQTDLEKLPFEENTFDFIVIWQVFEHVLTFEGKKILIDEALRVVKSGGHVLVETPNFLFPFDYHDNNLPLVHWFLPKSCRRKITKLVRREDYPPSEYVTIFQIKNCLKLSKYLKSFEQKTKIYFEEKYSDIFKHMGGTRIIFKKIFFSLYAPIYFILKLTGLPGDTFTPSLRVVFKIEK